ncbi:NAC domain-containing protein 2-like [Telopea speciosissima]|uniref:NAC domain-containing protein 2-like n=1 Tax=Telopea speciosissima TaxID=54955 RepID=UPI001CC35D61|nr:NAC domain-containing protein 2-like [Telopea speciosissima]
MSIPYLPPGFIFMPTDSEQLQFLKDKLLGRLDQYTSGFIPDNINPYGCDPVELPKGDHFERTHQAYFFTHKNQNRTLKDGFWMASALPEEINNGGQMLGLKEEFNFFWSVGKVTIETNWVMREYSINPAIFSEGERRAIGNMGPGWWGGQKLVSRKNVNGEGEVGVKLSQKSSDERRTQSWVVL